MITLGCDTLEIAMPWTENIRRDYARNGLRHASDSTDEEWAVVVRFMSAQNKVGRPWMTDSARLGCDPVHGGNGMPVGDAAEGIPYVYHLSGLSPHAVQ